VEPAGNKEEKMLNYDIGIALGNTSIPYILPMLGIQIRRIRMFFGPLDPDPLVRVMDPAPDPFPSLFS
jgi:hypothetical protein